MGKLNPARVQTQNLVSVAAMESRAQKPQRINLPVTVESIPVTPAETAKVPHQAPPEIAVTVTQPGKSAK
jgi:hypothetical protein